ncbi:MAG: DUF4301 family protein [Prolixibacteraceae bacterium]|jgi:hypothetical protein|nr:DUF4301 family protein [Prolixibacteraceae bacterium]
MLTEENLEQTSKQGITKKDIENQLRIFEQGFPPLEIVEAATPANGIKILSDDEEARHVSIFENALSSGLNATKFVPASGAASRMFKDLYNYLETDEETDFIKTFIENIDNFAFYEQLKAITPDETPRKFIENLLSEEGLNYGKLPKGLLTFHKYKDKSRTPFEEHLVEAAAYCAGSKGIANIHFTISPEHKEGFDNLIKNVVPEYQKRFGIKFNISFSVQHKSTDTIAVDLNNKPFKDEDGSLVFRPGGHGALIQNLNELDSDIIFIKNIDNVVPDKQKHYNNRYKKALAGLLVSVRNKAFEYLEKLNKPEAENNAQLLKNVEDFLKKELHIYSDTALNTPADKLNFYKTLLNRPIRICGMVKNQGEPGGGPFLAKNPNGTVSLQIVEKAQIDMDNPQQVELLNKSTHFNPVDIICSTKNYKGQKFDLLKHTDPNTGFISVKSKSGKEMKALELPGLWNGAMSDWNTVFVEVPIETFNPVKTVIDLLRPEHQKS